MRWLMLVVVLAVAELVGPASAAAAPAGSAPIRIGFCGGDDWEPAFAASGSFVYVAWTHFVGDPTCDPASASPGATDISVSSDGGKTFAAPHPVFTAAVGGITYPQQADPQVAVGGDGAVYVSFLGYGNSGGHTDVILARSTDHGATFSSAQKVNTTHDCKNCDHSKLVISGSDIYLAYSQATNHFISHSHAGGAFVQDDVLRENVVAFAEGGVADAAGNVWYAWADCESSNCTGVPAVVYRVSETRAGTLSTAFTDVATSVQGPKCPFSSCGFAFFGAQDDIAVSGNGDLYLAWQEGQDPTNRGSPPIINLSRSTDGGATWQTVGRVDDKTASGCAGAACYALFPTLRGGPGSTLYASWMDDRNGSPIDHENGWNVWLRSSTTAGTSWTGPSQRISQFMPTESQSGPNGFLFPYGDYMGLALNSCGQPMLVWGEGHDWVGGPTAPGHINYRTLC
jgi:hypothetical protein